jgi:hypothetical protein
MATLRQGLVAQGGIPLQLIEQAQVDGIQMGEEGGRIHQK